MRYSVINADLQEYLTNNPNLSEKQVLKWMLKQIMKPMERNVAEIAKLMNDSFLRFKTIIDAPDPDRMFRLKNCNIFQFDLTFCMSEV